MELVVTDARLRDGRVVDLAVEDGRVQIGPRGTLVEASAGARVLAAEGRLVTESAVDNHLHLDKVHTLDRVGDAALSAYTDDGMAGAMTSIELASAVKTGYRREDALPHVRRALTEAVRHGTLHLQAFVDVDTAAGLEGFAAVDTVRREFAGVLDVRIVAFPQDGVVRDPGAAELCEEALRLGADVVGGIPWIEHTDTDARKHVEWACALAAREGKRVAMLTDDAGDPALRTTEMLATAMLEHGLVGRGVACHARALALYPRPSLLRLGGLAARAGLGFVSDPQTGPLHLPVGLFRELGLPVALGQDDIEDAYYPFGRANLWEVAFLAAHLLEFRTARARQDLLDLVTVDAARVLGLDGHRLADGAPANFVVHDAERVVDVLRRHGPPRWVVATGAVVAETTSVSSVYPGLPAR
ncbi:amidohydrolase family protein [Cryptosporangium phraense]|uniref:Cytosine deaminase n=1 Tax=Cryptosporangium phraense TaxID=2593070 RepID=A0A545AFH3_9ACTN|nr:amidohydrolase family protein [Cryptosporangium phraense]TQS40082.1 cytosine deaminase [Cryptosporangium phraense]